MSTSVARRYAQALYQEAAANDQVARTDADVETLAGALAGSRELTAMLESPVVPRARKQAVLDRLFGERLGPLAARFVRLLIEKEREALLPAIVRVYAAQRDAREGIVEAHVRSAVPLGEAEQATLRRTLEAREGKQVRLHVTVEPDLIGGLVVRIGDVVYDRSVRHQLAVLREQFEARAAYHTN